MWYGGSFINAEEEDPEKGALARGTRMTDCSKCTMMPGAARRIHRSEAAHGDNRHSAVNGVPDLHSPQFSARHECRAAQPEIYRILQVPLE